MADPATLLATTILKLLISTFDACLTPANDALKDTVSSCINLHKNRSSLSDSLRQLKTLAEKLKENVEEEEAQLRICNPDVREWLKEVDEAVIRANPLLVNYNRTDSGSQPSTCIYCNANPFRRFRSCRKVIRALQNVDGLLIEGSLFTPPFTSPPRPEAVLLMPILKPTFGIDAVMHRVWSQFNDKHTSIVGLYGLGGVGKTTLLKSFNNELKKRNDGYQFHVVIMLEVANAKTLDVVGMQRIISNRLGLPWNNDESDDNRATFLLQVLTKKKFVVLLDDVWNKFKLEHVGIPTPLPEGNEGNGSKLIVASRGETVCANMGAVSPIEVHCLQKDEAWILFLSKLTERVRAFVLDDKDVKQCAEEIVNSCGGLPLAIDVIGSALAVSLVPQQWNDAAAAMRQDPSSIDGVVVMLHILQYSYDILEDTQKECFLYCTMFPGSVNMEQLMDYWSAEKLLKSERYDGYSIINNLLTACLLQRSDTEPASQVKMHQMIRNMGQQASAENKLLIQAGQALKQAPDAMEWEKATRISLISNDFTTLSITPNCDKLLTLLLQNNTNLHQLSSKFFHFMPVLKVLDLSHTAISELPDCSKLVQLVYLNLSHTLIKEVPKQLCNALVQLQFLNMSHTLITRLPQQLANLEKLTHLNLEETPVLTIIPHGTISRLFKLKVLNLYKSNYGVKDLPDLNLERLQQLTSLGITIYSQEVFRKLRKSDPLAICTRSLSLSLCLGMKFILLSEFKTMRHLRELHIESCDELEELIVDNIDKKDSANKVKVLTLANLTNLADVSCGFGMHPFQDLRDLTIHKCPKLENVSWVLLLESLERIVITESHGLKQVIQEEIDPMHERDLNDEILVQKGRNMLPKLRIMELKRLSQLESIGRKTKFPCLESITVDECPNLKLLLAPNIYPKLKQICGKESWWKTTGLEGKAAFEDIFITI